MSEIAKTTEEEAAATPPSRRRFIQSLVATALGVSLADVGDTGEFRAAAQTPPGCSMAGDAFVPVGELVSNNGLLNVDLTVKVGDKSVATIAGQGYQCRTMKLRYYEGQYHASAKPSKWPVNPVHPGPGPTLRMRVGDKVQVHLHNAINPAAFGKTTTNDMACDVMTQFDPATGTNKPLYPQDDKPPSCLHGDNLTNLHFHGTHVTPDGAGDNVMLDIHPGQSFTNNFTIPMPPPAPNPVDPMKQMTMGQAPGTHWYHAHKHGSVALQLLNGMAGAFIIEGEFDAQLEALIPGLRKTEKVLVIQQLGDSIMIQPGTPLNTCAGGDPRPLVNGQLQPTIQMQPGEIQRWRIINATMQQVSHLRYSFTGAPSSPGYKPAIRQIAYDGIQLAPERYNDPNDGLSQQFTIAPGNRIDILVQAPATPGKALLAYEMLHGQPPAGCPVLTTADPFLVQLEVSGSPVTPAMNFPTPSNYPVMPDWLQWKDNAPGFKILKTRTLQFNNSTDPSFRPAINGKAFDGTLATTQLVDLNAAEEWTLENYWASSIHPFHIHVNPFQVLEIYDPNAATQVTLQAPYNWQDTIAIPAAKVEGAVTTPGRVRIRSRFVDFTGTFVLHCHILDHEDRGMMEEVRILDPQSTAVAPLPMHH